MTKNTWVNCPICNEPDMPCEHDPDEPELTQISCCNFGCPSNVQQSSIYIVAIFFEDYVFENGKMITQQRLYQSDAIKSQSKEHALGKVLYSKDRPHKNLPIKYYKVTEIKEK